MRRVVFDIETNGFLDEVSVIHCLVLRDLDSDAVVSCTDAGGPTYRSIAEGLTILGDAEIVYGHNIISYDLKVLKKLRGFEPKGTIRDTYPIVMMRWAHIKDSDFARAKKGTLPKKLIGKHTLEAWGYRLGVQKVGTDIEDWSQWTPLMQERCVSDTAVNKAVVQRIKAARVSKESVETEIELARYLAQQEQNGWPFDVEKAIALQGQLAAKRQEIGNELIATFGSWFVSAGEALPKKNNKVRGIMAGVPYTRLKVVEFNPASRDHIANRLIKLYGWKPEVFTDSGKPKVDADILKGLTYPPIAKLREYLIVADTLGTLVEGKQAWMKHFTKDRAEGGKLTGLPHIHGGVQQTGTITHRASHVHPPLTQAPKVGKPWGVECRTLFHVPPGWVQIGADASGLELRCLAHYLAKYDGGAYGRLVLDGDVHSVTQAALAEWLEVLGPKVGRDRAKTWFYAFLYGAGDEKLGKILAPGKSQKQYQKIGAAGRAMFLQQLAALKYLLKELEKQAKPGYLITLDGRRVYVRSAHAILNTLLQTAGAIICKRWIVTYNSRLMEMFDTPYGGGYRHAWAALGWFHDESQLATRDDPKVIEPTKTILIQSIRDMTQHFNFQCPLDGEAKVGANWCETH